MFERFHCEAYCQLSRHLKCGLQKCIFISHYKQKSALFLKSICMHLTNKPKFKQICRSIQDYSLSKVKDQQQPNIFSNFYEEPSAYPIFKSLTQSKSKVEKDNRPQRLSFKKLTFNQTIVSKRQIILTFTKRKNEELELSFEIQGKKFKLLTTSDSSQTQIVHNKSFKQIQIRAKSATKLQYTNQKHKKTEISKQKLSNISIKCNYGCKNYDSNKIEIFFLFHHCNYGLQPISQSTTSPSACSNEPEEEQQSHIDFDLPIDANVDWPIEDMLSCVKHTPPVQQGQTNYLKDPPETLKSSAFLEDSYQQEQKEAFRQLTPQQLQSTYQERLAITRLHKKQKIKILNSIFKIKNVELKDYPPYTKLRCLNDQCSIFFQHYTQLKLHLQTHHPRLVSLGITVDQKGRYECSQKALDFALILGRMFPRRMKKVIKGSKTRR